MMDKARLLDTYGQLYSYYYQLGDTVDCYYSSLVPSTGYIRLFDIVNTTTDCCCVSPAVKTRPNWKKW